MSEKTPVERAARALDKWLGASLGCHETAATDALIAAVQDREGLARVMYEGIRATGIGMPPWESMSTHRQYPYRVQADAVARWLTGEES